MSLNAALKGVGILVASVGLAACSPMNTTSESSLDSSPMVQEQQQNEDSNDAMMAQEMNIVETAAAAGQFNTLLQLATQAGLADALATSEVTVFAPTDEAFAKLPPATLEAVQNDPELLANVLKYHVVPGSVPASQIVTMTELDTLLGQSLMVKVTGSTVMINDATIIMPDVMASNGVIHAVDTVIVPQQ